MNNVTIDNNGMIVLDNNMVKENKQLIANALIKARKDRGLFGFSSDEVNNLVNELLGEDRSSILEELKVLGVVKCLDLEDDEIEYFNSLLEPKYYADNDYCNYVSLDYFKDVDNLDYYLVRRLR